MDHRLFENIMMILDALNSEINEAIVRGESVKFQRLEGTKDLLEFLRDRKFPWDDIVRMNKEIFKEVLDKEEISYIFMKIRASCGENIFLVRVEDEVRIEEPISRAELEAILRYPNREDAIGDFLKDIASEGLDKNLDYMLGVESGMAAWKRGFPIGEWLYKSRAFLKQAMELLKLNRLFIHPVFALVSFEKERLLDLRFRGSFTLDYGILARPEELLWCVIYY